MRVQYPGIGKGLRWMGGWMGGMGVLGTRDVMVGGAVCMGGQLGWARCVLGVTQQWVTAGNAQQQRCRGGQVWGGS